MTTVPKAKRRTTNPEERERHTYRKLRKEVMDACDEEEFKENIRELLDPRRRDNDQE